MTRPGLLAVLPLLWATASAAQQTRNFGQIADSLTGQVTSFGNLVGVVGMLAGLAMLVMAAVKFRAYSNNDPQATLTGSVGWLVAGILLVALPEFMGVGVTSLFGEGNAPGNFRNPLSSLASD